MIHRVIGFTNPGGDPSKRRGRLGGTIGALLVACLVLEGCASLPPSTGSLVPAVPRLLEHVARLVRLSFGYGMLRRDHE